MPLFQTLTLCKYFWLKRSLLSASSVSQSSMASKQGGSKGKIRDEVHVMPVGSAAEHLPSRQIQMPDVEELSPVDRSIFAAIQALGHYPRTFHGSSCGRATQKRSDERRLYWRLKKRASKMDRVCLAFIEAYKQCGGVTEAREAARRSFGLSSSSKMSVNAGDTLSKHEMSCSILIWMCLFETL